MPPLRSLRARLFAFLLVLAALAALLVGGATYVGVRAETDALFDDHLQQMALSLRDQGRIADEERATLADPALDYVVQIWSIDGVALYTNRPRSAVQPLPPRAILGFSDVELGGSTWRVFGAATALRVVQVGQPLAVRQRRAADAAWRSVLPIGAALPLVALGLWWLLGVSLAPLRRVVQAAQARGVATLQPLPDAGLPAEVAPLVASFNALLARLDAAFGAQRSFVADAAHELRTPLTALKLQVGLLREADTAAEHAAALDRLAAGVERAARLVEQLLALARAEPGRAAPMVALDLAEVARLALADAAPLAAARGATLHAELPATLPMNGDAQALRSLLRNLLDNAIKHGGAAPRVTLRLARAGERLRLQVDDSGPGIPVADRARVFDRFQRRQDDGGDGSGLGLAIVQAVAAQHGASVTLLDAPGGGLRVEVEGPAGSAVAMPATPPTPPTP